MDNKEIYLVISQKKLKLILGGLGVGLPTILFLGNMWVYGETEILGSISSYYHSRMRDLFVGVLFTMGVFLIAYEGYNVGDRILSSIGGILAIIVALAPTTAPGGERGMIGTVHLVAAATFYFILMIFCLFLFTKSDENIAKTKLKRIRNLIYYVCGLSILASLILLILTESSIISIGIDKSTFWLEYVANTAFGTAWLVKGEGIFFLNDDPILQMNPWEVLGIVILLLLALGSLIMLSMIII